MPDSQGVQARLDSGPSFMAASVSTRYRSNRTSVRKADEMMEWLTPTQNFQLPTVEYGRRCYGGRADRGSERLRLRLHLPSLKCSLANRPRRHTAVRLSRSRATSLRRFWRRHAASDGFRRRVALAGQGRARFLLLLPRPFTCRWRHCLARVGTNVEPPPLGCWGYLWLWLWLAPALYCGVY